MIKHNILIFVGPDNTGKTEISKELSLKLNYQYYKNNVEHEHFKNKDNFNNILNYHGPAFVDFLTTIKIEEGLILDRFIPCEYAYAKTYNREYNEPLIFDLDDKLSKLNSVIIYCYKNSYKDFVDEVVELKDMETVKKYYEEYFNKTKIPVIKIETSSENLELQINEILNKLENIKK